MKPDDKRRLPVLLCLSALTGVTAMFYLSAWTIRLWQLFGATVGVTGLSAGVFLLGVAIGAGVFEKYFGKKKNPLIYYGLASGFVALFCVFTLMLMNRLAALLLSAMAVSLLSTLLPSVVMGFAISALFRESADGREGGALLGAHFIGAAGGALLAGDFVIGWIGLDGAAWLASAANGAVALATFLVFVPGRAAAESVKSGGGKAIDEKPSVGHDISPGAANFALFLLCMSGFAAGALWVCWTRALSLAMGDTVYNTAAIIAGILAGIGAGSLLLTRPSSHIKYPVAVVGAFEVGACALVMVLALLIDDEPNALIHLYEATQGAFVAMAVFQFALISFIVAPPCVLIGGAFPVIFSVAPEKRRAPLVYGLFAAFAALGCAAAVYYVIPVWGVQQGVLVSGAILGVSGIATMAASSYKYRWRAVAGGAALAGLLAYPASRPWDMHKLSWGVYGQLMNLNGSSDLAGRLAREKVEYLDENPVAQTMVVKNRDSRVWKLNINAKAVASTAPFDMALEYIMGHLPVILTEEPSRALVIGLGSGMTAGAVAAHQNTEVTCVDPNPASREIAAKFAFFNNHLLDRKNVKTVVMYGRRYLAGLPPESLDLIVLSPSHPFTPDASAYYSRDFYELCMSRLRPGGILCQWLPLYQLGEDDIKTIIATFIGAAPDASLWMAYQDAVMVGFRGSTKIDLNQIEARHLSNPVFREGLRKARISNGSQLAGRLLLGPEQLRAFTEGASVSADDAPSLMFTAPGYLYKGVTAANWRMLARLRSREIEQYVKGGESAMEQFRSSGDATVLVIEALFQLEDNESEKAAKTLEAALKIEPENQAAKVEMANMALSVVEPLIAQGRRDDAVKVVNKALEYDPDNSEALRWLAHQAIMRNSLDYAKNLLKRAHNAAPLNSEILADLGLLHLQLGFIDQGLKEISDAVELEPDRARPYFAQGLALEMMGWKKEAGDSYKFALRLDPNMVEAGKRLEALGGGD